ncbi:hypothetical protein DFJ58DRAFT_738403 [Suillus subalutaceus]|uniref:uncharacterized protein n=1 Tax=Suillus subalutaceus TaxID=48586 RepID=UPI001B8852C1|nr:uncharacterized protein DFJ58DRAFT_738403 [Suillus subalutaceus]KAG1826486.1 hypothetical protein DFJ58DRAFT_738403 [Suillus subalutaceus]
MFGPELPFSQAIASPLSRIPLSSPIGPPVTVSLASPVTASPSMPATPLFATQTRPLTLRRAFRYFFASSYLFVLFASTQLFDLPPISSAYLVTTHAFAADWSFSFPIVKGRPHSLARSP